MNTNAAKTSLRFRGFPISTTECISSPAGHHHSHHHHAALHRLQSVNKAIMIAVSVTILISCLLLSQKADAAPAPKGRTGTVTILAYPEVVDVYVDGEFKGNTPFSKPLSLSVGEHTFKVTARGHTEYKSAFNISRGRNTTIEVDLLPIAGILKINTDNNIQAQVLVDGEPMGTTPFNMDIPVGERTITVKADGYREYRETLSIEALKEYDYSINLIPANMAGGMGPDSRYPHELPPDQGEEEYAYGHNTLFNQWWFWTAAGAITLSAAAIGTGLLINNRPEIIEADTSINMYFK